MKYWPFIQSWFRRARLAVAPGPGREHLRRESSLRLTPHHSVHLVSLGERRWLVVCHAAGASPLAEFPADGAARGAAAG